MAKKKEVSNITCNIKWFGYYFLDYVKHSILYSRIDKVSAFSLFVLRLCVTLTYEN
jgi:hypothetical protein